MKIKVLFFILFLASAVNIFGQNNCLTSGEAKKLIASIQSPTLKSENKKLRKEIIGMRAEQEKINAKIVENVEKNQKLIPEAHQMGERQLMRVCQILKENGWLTRDVLGEDGFDALTYLMTNNKAFQLQRELLPVLIEATKAGFFGNNYIASMIDNIRIGARLPQIFGTQATIRNNVVYIYPLLNEEKVNSWRKLYNLPPLAAQIRNLENSYLMPVLKMQRLSLPPNLQQKKIADADTKILGIADDENEVLKIDTKLVSLNVQILSPDVKIPTETKLSKDDFTVLENDEPQDIVFFSAAEQPFDLVLLLDFSLSTVEKRDVIKKAAQRFVEYARPTDRIAVVVFASEIVTVSDLTTDKAALVEKIKNIEVNGGSPIWDSLSYVYKNIIERESVGRRSAIVFMTDAEDNSREKTFADAMETVRRSDTTIYPVYFRSRSSGGWAEKFQQKSQQSLWMLAEETGGFFYKADDAKDLSGIYEQVINDLGKIYSIGYEPKNQIRDGGWRNIRVKIKNQPNLIARTRRGYYAN